MIKIIIGIVSIIRVKDYLEMKEVFGGRSHCHCISDKSGIPLDDLLRRIKVCDMPSSNVHIIIDKE